ncbi:hypothetical protein [Sinomonas soli]
MIVIETEHPDPLTKLRPLQLQERLGLSFIVATGFEKVICNGEHLPVCITFCSDDTKSQLYVVDYIESAEVDILRTLWIGDGPAGHTHLYSLSVGFYGDFGRGGQVEVGKVYGVYIQEDFSAVLSESKLDS